MAPGLAIWFCSAQWAVKTQPFCVSCPTTRFFSLHFGALYGRYALLDRFQPYQVRALKETTAV
jgi:hypothetical protein